MSSPIKLTDLLRRARGALSQKEYARAIGVSPSRWNRLEAGTYTIKAWEAVEVALESERTGRTSEPVTLAELLAAARVQRDRVELVPPEQLPLFGSEGSE